MAEVPEHLLKRAAERRAQLDAQKGAAAPPGGEAGEGAPPSEGSGAAETASGGDQSRIPASILARSQAARARAQAGGGGGGGEETGGGGAATTTLERPETAAARGIGGRSAAPVAGVGGHTQRLLTVVKAGSIQDVKATPADKVNVWPHLLVVEFGAALAMSAFLIVFSTFVNAPLLAMANFNQTPNPSKAPWYFLGLQELLTMFHPMVAGVTIPGMGLFVLGMAGYIDKNPSHRPEDRKLATALFTLFMMFWAVLVMVGSFFRGEGFNFILPWRQGVHDIFDL